MKPLGGVDCTLNRRINRSFEAVHTNRAEIVQGRDFLAGQLSIAEEFRKKKKLQAENERQQRKFLATMPGASATVPCGASFGDARSANASSLGSGAGARSTFTSGMGHSSCPTLPPLLRKPAATSSCSWVSMGSHGSTQGGSFGIGSFTFSSDVVERLYARQEELWPSQEGPPGSSGSARSNSAQPGDVTTDAPGAAPNGRVTVHQRIQRLEANAEKNADEIGDRRSLLDWYKDQIVGASSA